MAEGAALLVDHVLPAVGLRRARTWQGRPTTGAIGPRQRAKSTAAGPVAVERARRPAPRTGTCAAARSRALGPILSRFCRDSALSRDKLLNSGSYGPLRDHTHHITNVNDDGTIPKVPVDNYKVYNNFRSGDLSPPDGKKTPDLTLNVPDLCSFECVDNKLVLWVHVGNEGASPLTAGAKVEVRGLVLGKDTALATTNLVDIIAPGEYLGALAYEIDPSDLASLTITVGTQEQECNLNNNKVVIQGPFCKM